MSNDEPYERPCFVFPKKGDFTDADLAEMLNEIRDHSAEPADDGAIKIMFRDRSIRPTIESVGPLLDRYDDDTARNFAALGSKCT